MARRDLARGVRVMARLAAGSEIAPDQPQIGPLSDWLDVVHRVRCGQHALAQAPPAQWVGFQLREAQRSPGCIVSARRGRAAPAIEQQSPLRATAERGLVDRRTIGHQVARARRRPASLRHWTASVTRQERDAILDHAAGEIVVDRQLRRALREFLSRNARLIRRPRLAPGQRMPHRPAFAGEP